jgi:hypothetical protein
LFEGATKLKVLDEECAECGAKRIGVESKVRIESLLNVLLFVLL